jgi:hypothetical protein
MRPDPSTSHDSDTPHTRAMLCADFMFGALWLFSQRHTVTERHPTASASFALVNPARFRARIMREPIVSSSMTLMYMQVCICVKSCLWGRRFSLSAYQ